MRRFLTAVVAALVSGSAAAAAGAHVTITARTPVTLTAADGTVHAIDGNTALLRTGETIAYEFDYRLEVFDSGALVQNAQGGSTWSPLGITINATGGPFGAIAFHGFEVAAASLYFSLIGNPWLNFQGTSDFLATASDAQAEHLVRTGHGRASVTLMSGWGVEQAQAFLPDPRMDEAALFDDIAAPVPEPSAIVLLLAGLGALVVRHATVQRRS